MKKENLHPLITPQEAADYLRVPRSWIYSRTQKGEIPMRKLGGHIRFIREEFLAWIEDSK